MNWKFIFIAFLVLSSCESKSTITKIGANGEFKKIDSLTINFDNIGSIDRSNIGSYYNENGGAVAIIRTTIDRRYIDIFNLKDGELLNKIPIEYEGPDGVGGEISNIVISNPNSVFIFNQWTGFLTHHGTDGKIIDKYKINFNELGGRGYLSPGSLSFQNYVIHSNKIYIPGWLPWAYQSKSTEQIGVVNLKTKEVETTFSRPTQYEHYFWGEGSLYDLYMDFHSGTKELILSFPIENDLILFNPKNQKTRRVKAISKYFSEVTPYTSDFENIDRQGLLDHGRNNDYFNGVIFDPSNNYTYRIASRSTYDLDANQNSPRSLSLIIIDEDFEKLDEIELDLQNLDFSMAFTSNKGWYILNQKLTYQQEGQLVFDIYSYR